jgi:hypothetical protein
VNAKREMLAGLGHPQHNVRAGGPRGERAASLQDWAMKQLRADVEQGGTGLAATDRSLPKTDAPNDR